MLKCDSCKNPIAITSLNCEWCGAKIIRNSENQRDLKSNESNINISDFINKLNEIENEIIKESSSSGTWGVLDGIFSRAFGNAKIDSLNQKKATIIQTYPLPKSSDELLEIANMAISNYNNIKVFQDF